MLNIHHTQYQVLFLLILNKYICVQQQFHFSVAMLIILTSLLPHSPCGYLYRHMSKMFRYQGQKIPELLNLECFYCHALLPDYSTKQINRFAYSLTSNTVGLLNRNRAIDVKNVNREGLYTMERLSEPLYIWSTNGIYSRQLFVGNFQNLVRFFTL